ncbi:MAG: hypothetical protein LH477_00610 [Nocardioides sp.]|nr:hypothetical protein [Nocardioides sp.]
MARNTIFRSAHDLGLSAWFGGTLANAVSLNAAASAADSAAGSGAVVNAGWDRWTPVNAAAIGAHLVGSVGLIAGNADRLRNQRGVATMATVKTVLTVAALGVTARSRMLGRTISEHGAVPVESGTAPAATTPAPVAAAQKQLATLQWVIPALTGAIVVVSAFAGEQQRASEVAKGVLGRVRH